MNTARRYRWLVVPALVLTVAGCRKHTPTYEYEKPVTTTWTGTGAGAAAAAPPSTLQMQPVATDAPVTPPPSPTTLPNPPAIITPPTTTPAAPTPTSTTIKRSGWVRPGDPPR